MSGRKVALVSGAIVFAALTSACMQKEESGSKPGTTPAATTTVPLSPCGYPLSTSSIRIQNHEGHGDGRVPVPDAYHSLRNPCPLTTPVIDEGKRIFDEQCARCHGTNGDPASGATTGPLEPPAKKLTVGGFSDAYVFWRVREGGAFEPFNSAMPAFKDNLSEEQSWMVTTHVLGLVGADLVPVTPTQFTATAIAEGVELTWRLASECQALRLERRKDEAPFEFWITLNGFLTETRDTEATEAGKYCYRIACEAGGTRSEPSGEQCAAR